MIPEEVAVLADILGGLNENSREHNVDLAYKIYNGLETTQWYLTVRSDPE